MVNHSCRYAAAMFAAMLIGCAGSAATTARSAVVPGSIVVLRKGILLHRLSGDETAASCARFQLRGSDAREFFARAVRVDARTFNHELDGSNCATTGRARKWNAEQVTWTIDLERRGELVLSTGRHEYFYCSRCSSSLYDVADDAVAATNQR